MNREMNRRALLSAALAAPLARIVPTGASPAAVGGDDGAINTLLATLTDLSGQPGTIDALASAIRGIVATDDDLDDRTADRILADVAAIEARAEERWAAEPAAVGFKD